MTIRRRPDDGPRWWIAFVYLLSLVFVIPWYWPAGDTRHLYGMPIWALATLSAVFATSVFTVWIYLAKSDDGSD